MESRENVKDVAFPLLVLDSSHDGNLLNLYTDCNLDLNVAVSSMHGIPVLAQSVQ